MRRCAARAGFTAEELVTALFIILLGSVFILHLGRVGWAMARASSCESNVRQLATAARSYASDSEGLMPPGPQAFGPLNDYVRSTQIYVCPSAKRPAKVKLLIPSPEGQMTEQDVQVSYIMNPQARLDDLPATMLVGEDAPDRHVGHRWVGVRLDGAAHFYPARAWEPNWGAVMSHAKPTKR